MNHSHLKRFAIIAMGVLATWFSIIAHGKQQEQPLLISRPAQFLVDKEAANLVGIVKVKHAGIRWVILPDGDHLSVIVSECEMEQVISGSQEWPAKTTQTVTQYDYSDLISEPIAPPVMDGRRYVLFASSTPKNGEIHRLSPWTAHPQGFVLVRGQKDAEFTYWNGNSYAVDEIRNALATNRRLPLDQIVDPVRRLRVAEARRNDGNLGDEKAFIHGLQMNVLDPEGQAKNVEQIPKSGTIDDMFGMNQGNAQPHALWYNSLALLRDMGKEATRRKDIVEVLTPIARTARPTIRLAAALALVDLGSDAGREALIKGFESDSGAVSSDPSDRMTFPGRYPYDQSSVTASAHALARLGDRRGLKHPKTDVRLATAEALKDKPDPEIRKMLQDLATELEPQVEKLRTSGDLTKPRRPGEYTNRFPTDWVRTQRLLARSGDDQGLRKLVEAYLEDARTYPQEQAPLMPRGRVVSWSSGSSPAQSILGANESPAQVLDRLQKLYAQDMRWDSPSFKVLRTSLQEPRSTEAKETTRPKPTEADIAKLLGNSDPNRRAEGLAAAGYHQMGAFYAKVLDSAINEKGVERNAAIYSLGFYERDVPEESMRQILATDDVELRFSAIELATRKNGAHFVQETMEFVHMLTGNASKAKLDDWKAQRYMAYLPRILSRLARGPIPQLMLDGLKDPDPAIRRIVVKALELSGNPDAVRSIEPLTRNADTATREASQAALRALGPVETSPLNADPLPVNKQSSEWKVLNDEARLLGNQGLYDQAVLVTKRALMVAEKTGASNPTNVATSLNNLAALYQAQGQYEQVESFFRRSLAIREKSLGPNHPVVAESLSNLAALHQDQGQYAQAEPLNKRALAIWEMTLGSEHPNVATSMSNLATLYQAQGLYSQAEPLFIHSLAIREKTLGPNHPVVAESLSNLAALFQAQTQYAQAEPLSKRALAIKEKVLGPDHHSVGTSLNNLAVLYKIQGLYEQAEPLCKRSLAIRESALGPDHPNVARILNNLAELYQAQGKYAQAEPLFKRSLAISEKTLGPNHPDVAKTLENIASLYRKTDREKVAEEIEIRAVAIRAIKR